MEFDPPIPSRTTEELIAIFHFPEDWNQEAVKQAESELLERNISQDEQNEIVERLTKEVENLNAKIEKEQRNEKYSYLDMFFMCLYLPRTILTDWSLEKDGYTILHKQRLQTIIAGFVFWSIMVLVGINTFDREAIEWQNEVNNEDIYEWEREYYSDEDFIESRKAMIEQVINSATNKEAMTTVLVLVDSDTIPEEKILTLHKLDHINIRNVIFERILEPEPYERITFKLVK
ncbi:MAG: hypothetical protein OCD76_00020 [Reichenbachiella sp.]